MIKTNYQNVIILSYAGTVKYIGRLEGGLSNDVYIGVQLDAPGSELV